MELGQTGYSLDIAHGRLTASVAMVVRGITLNTKPIDPAEWFARLAEETRKATDHAKTLSESLVRFHGKLTWASSTSSSGRRRPTLAHGQPKFWLVCTMRRFRQQFAPASKARATVCCPGRQP